MASPRVRRLADAVFGATSADGDFRSVAEFCAACPVGVSPSTLRWWSRTEGIEPRRLLDLSRMLRAVRLAERHGGSASDFLDVDPRTFSKLAARGGFAATAGLTVAQFCRLQRYVTHEAFRAEIAGRCGAAD